MPESTVARLAKTPMAATGRAKGLAMRLVPFVLEEWLGKYRDSAVHHLGMSTGPKGTLAELRALMTDAERDAKRRQELERAHSYFTVSTSMPSELLAETAVRNRETIFGRTRAASGANLAVLAGGAKGNPWVALTVDSV